MATPPLAESLSAEVEEDVVDVDDEEEPEVELSVPESVLDDDVTFSPSELGAVAREEEDELVGE